jgi:hypothetical protein
VTDDGPMVRAYHEKYAGYLHAAMRYNALRLAGGSRWAADAERCRREVRAAMDAWVCCGYRNEVDQVTAYLDQVGNRSLVPWLRDLVELFDGSMVNGGQFPYTTMVPADLASSAACWVDIALDWSEVAGGRGPGRSRPVPWRSGAAAVSFDLDGVHGLSGFALHARLSQVVISRPWFYPQFFANRGWTLDGGPVCDGGDPPSGRLIGYPAAALVVRDLRIDCPELAAACRRHADDRSLGWGPFQLAGGRLDDGCISVPGLQLIGLVNQRFGRGTQPAATTGYRVVRLNGRA